VNTGTPDDGNNEGFRPSLATDLPSGLRGIPTFLSEDGCSLYVIVEAESGPSSLFRLQRKRTGP
jgi:hypothetical protein